MDSKITNWLSTSTSGQGVSLLLVTATGYLNGAITWQAAVAGAAGALALIAFPQNQKLAEVVQTTTLDVEKVVDAYRLGLGHGQSISGGAGPQVSVAAVPAPMPTTATAPTPVATVGHGATL